MCGFIGLVRQQDSAAPLLYEALLTLQHRGQDSAGIATWDGQTLHLKKGAGLVADIFKEEHFRVLQGREGIAHVRYPTIGSNSEEDAQPFHTTHPWGITLAHNGNVTNVHGLRQDLRQNAHRLISSTCDAEVILQVFADALLESSKDKGLCNESVFEAVSKVLTQVLGAYSVALHIAGFGMVAFS